MLKWILNSGYTQSWYKAVLWLIHADIRDLAVLLHVMTRSMKQKVSIVKKAHNKKLVFCQVFFVIANFALHSTSWNYDWPQT